MWYTRLFTAVGTRKSINGKENGADSRGAQGKQLLRPRPLLLLYKPTSSLPYFLLLFFFFFALLPKLKLF